MKLASPSIIWTIISLAIVFYEFNLRRNPMASSQHPLIFLTTAHSSNSFIFPLERSCFIRSLSLPPCFFLSLPSHWHSYNSSFHFFRALARIFFSSCFYDRICSLSSSSFFENSLNLYLNLFSSE